jgi:type IV secretion system protein VirB8
MSLTAKMGRKSKEPAIAGDVKASKAKHTAIDPDDDLSIGKWYMKQAQEFERNNREGERKMTKVAFIVAGVAIGFAAVALIGALSLAVLKRPNPPAVLRVDASTGKVDVLPTTAKGHVTFDEKTDRADLRKYVEARESYDWETINDMHDYVMLESDDHEKDLYDSFVRGPRGPLVMLKDQVRIIANVSVITFVGDTAQVFFSKRVAPLSSGMPVPAPEYWIATVSFKRVDVPETTDAQDLDPDGFRVTSYRVDRDWSRAPAQSQPAAGGK